MLSRVADGARPQVRNAQPWLAPENWLISPLPQSPSRRCPDSATANEARNHVIIRCHPIRGSRFYSHDNRRLYAITTIVAEIF